MIIIFNEVLDLAPPVEVIFRRGPSPYDLQTNQSGHVV